MEHFKNLTIQVIDQDKISRERISFYLRNMGFSNTSSFENPEVCIEELKKSKPEVIILSQNEDAWASFEILKRIKAINPDIYVIYVADTKETNLLVNAQNFGAFDYVFKSHQLESMLHISIQKVLDVNDLLLQKPVKSRLRFMALYTL